MATQTIPVQTPPRHDARPGPRGRSALAGAAALGVVLVVALLWSKWWPYGHKVADVARSGAWSEPSVLDTAGHSGSAPSLHGGWDYTVAYGKAVWMAWVAVLVVAAASTSLVPHGWLRRVLGRRSAAGGTLAGGLLGTITLFCTACAAPLAVSLRRDGVRSSTTLAYLYAGPVLNPAVLAILAVVGPWQWAAVRIVVGLVLVFGLSAVAARFGEAGAAADAAAFDGPVQDVDDPTDARGTALHFARRLITLAVTLTPIYFVLTFVEGALRGVAFPISGATATAGAVVAALLLGALIDLPTAGEVPILLALSAAGAGTAAVGALLITLPAISLITMVMILRSHGTRVSGAAGAAVVVAGAASAVLLAVLS